MTSSQPSDNNSSASSITVNLFLGSTSFLASQIQGLLEAPEGQQVVVRHEVHEATGGGNENVAAHLELLTLALGGSAAIDDAGSQHGSVAQAAGLVEDLTCQLTSRTDDKYQRLGTNTVQ